MKDYILTLPTSRDLERTPRTKQSLAIEHLAGVTFDFALPQSWLDQAVERTLEDYGRLLSSVCWAYPNGHPAGLPAPLTRRAARALVEHGYNVFVYDHIIEGVEYPPTR